MLLSWIVSCAGEMAYEENRIAQDEIEIFVAQKSYYTGTFEVDFKC